MNRTNNTTGFAPPPRNPNSRVGNPPQAAANGAPQVAPRNTSLRAGQRAPAANVPANAAPVDPQAPAAHAQPAVNPDARNLAFGGGDLSNPVLRMRVNPFGGPGVGPQAVKPFAAADAGDPPAPTPANPGQAQPAPTAQGPAPGENPFDWLDKNWGTGRYAGITADGQVVPRIFGQTNSPAPLNNDPAAGGTSSSTSEFEKMWFPAGRPNVSPSASGPGVPTPDFNSVLFPPGNSFEGVRLPDGRPAAFVRADGTPESHPNPGVKREPIDPFSRPDASDGITPSFLPPAPTTAVDKTKLQIEQRTQWGVFCMGMHELVLRECVKQGLSPDVVKPLLDLFVDHGVEALKETQTIGISAGLLDSAAAPLDIPAIKASALARRADATKQAELTKLKLDKERSAPHHSPTFDPLTRKNGRKGSSLKHSEMEDLVNLLTNSESESDSGSASNSRSVKSQVINSYETISGSGKRIPRSLHTDDPDTDGDSSYDEDGADSSAEESVTDSQKAIEMSVTEDSAPAAPQAKASPQPLANQKQSKGAPPQPVQSPQAKPQQQQSPPVKSRPVRRQAPKSESARLEQQEWYRQDDLRQADMKRKGQLRHELMSQQTLAIADLDRQLKQMTDQSSQRSLLVMCKDQQRKLHSQAVNEWAGLDAKQKAGRPLTAEELARMKELDIRSTAALDHEKAIKTVAATHGIAL